jgi:hypothetical protein
MSKQTQKRVIFFKYFCDDFGEMDAFYEIVDGKLLLVKAWSNNDANYRNEYMSGLFSYLGIQMTNLPDKYEKEARALLVKAWGF